MTRSLRRCANCATTETCQWFRNKQGEFDCNACALRFKKYGDYTKRKQSNKVKKTILEAPLSIKFCDSFVSLFWFFRKFQPTTRHLGRRCANCATTETCRWHRNKQGELDCNACALRFKRNGDYNFKKDGFNGQCRADFERKSAALGSKHLNQLIHSNFKIY